MEITIIKEGVLNDDTLYVADENKVFKGGYVAILEYYIFQNSWSNRKITKGFKTLENANKFIDKTFKK
jgi:hypothetical protein